MSDVVLVALIAAIPATIAAITSIISGLYGKAKLTELHVMVNSRLDQLLKARGDAAYQAGIQTERTENRDRIEGA